MAEASKVPAAHNTLRILRWLAERPRPVSAASIARALELPRSTVYDLLGVMAANGFVVHLPEERRYGLGVAAFELSSAFSRQDPLARLGAPLLRAVVDELGESGHLAVLDGRDVVYIAEERARHRPSLVTDVGVRIPAHLTASGRSMLAGLSPAQLRALYPGREAFAARTALGTVTSPAALKAELQLTRQRGWAGEDGDVTPDFASVAVAVLDHRGLPVAGIALTFLSDRHGDAARPALAARLREVAAVLSSRLYGAASSGDPVAAGRHAP
ncbi:MAG: IclR family transcriptional regulator [Arthrobacter sp.]|jgi:DNA-binding IclR family transcriptional regulator|nr:IclR family transcriptional regulator [Arthrobacter sp.]